MNISAVNAATSAYGVTTQDSKAAALSQSGNATNSTQVDSVSLSPEALQQSRIEQYPLKDDPITLFQEWKEKEKDVISIAGTPKAIDELLPENIEFISQLRNEQKNVSSYEDKMMIEAHISTITRHGDNEIFTSKSDIQSRVQAEAESASLQANYLLEKNGELPFQLDKMKTVIPSLSDITGLNDTPVFKKEVASSKYLDKFDDVEFLDQLLKQIHKGTKRNEIGIVLPDMT